MERATYGARDAREVDGRKMCDQQQQRRRANDPQRREAVSDELTVPLIPTKSLSLGDEMNYNFSNFSFLALLLFNPRLLRRRRPRGAPPLSTWHSARRPWPHLFDVYVLSVSPMIKTSKLPVFRPNNADVENPSTQQKFATRVMKFALRIGGQRKDIILSNFWLLVVFNNTHIFGIFIKSINKICLIFLPGAKTVKM